MLPVCAKSVTTRLLPWEVNQAGLHSSFPGGDDMYRVYNAELQLSQVHYGEDMKAAGSRRRLKPYPLATPADRPPACVPSQRTRTSSPRDRPTTQPAFLVPAAAMTHSLARLCLSSRARATLAPTPFRCRTCSPAHLLTCSPAHLLTCSPGQGDARWRRGESVSLKTARDSMTSLELAQHAQMAYSAR
jgi:hypothetical protein